MTPPICKTCGVQHAESERPPDVCFICEDERQYVGPDGQEWTTPADLRRDHSNAIREIEPGLTSIVTTPKFGIGQHALLVRSPGGNVLWDCIALLDEATVGTVQSLGGLAAIAVSHPHYYGTMVDWSRTFGGVPIYVHEADRRWVARPDPAVAFWGGDEKDLHDGLKLVRCGGHFEGAAVLHWPSGAEGRGAILAGDVLQVCPDRKHVSFMYSYPNYIPLGADAVRKAAAAVEPLAFDRVHGFMPGLTIDRGGKEAVRASAARYLKAIGAA